MCGGNGGVCFFFKEIKWMITVFGLHIMKMKKLFIFNQCGISILCFLAVSAL